MISNGISLDTCSRLVRLRCLVGRHSGWVLLRQSSRHTTISAFAQNVHLDLSHRLLTLCFLVWAIRSVGFLWQSSLGFYDCHHWYSIDPGRSLPRCCRSLNLWSCGGNHLSSTRIIVRVGSRSVEQCGVCRLTLRGIEPIPSDEFVSGDYHRPIDHYGGLRASDLQTQRSRWAKGTGNDRHRRTEQSRSELDDCQPQLGTLPSNDILTLQVFRIHPWKR